MARGVRSNATLLPVFSPNLQPQSLSSYDPKTRRNTILIAEIVPTIDLTPGSGGTRPAFLPSDRYYTALGVPSSTGGFPPWFGTGLGSPTLQNYDSTEKFYYLDTNTGCTFPSASSAVLAYMWHAGWFGESSSFAPKNSGTSAVHLKFRAAFTQNADYTTYGVGAVSLAASFVGGAFASSAAHFIQVTRNAGSWELGTCDGATISQASGGTADSSAHEFWVKWEASAVYLYVDGALTITKTTNLPGQPIGPVFDFDGTNKARMYEHLIEWEAA